MERLPKLYLFTDSDSDLDCSNVSLLIEFKDEFIDELVTNPIFFATAQFKEILSFVTLTVSLHVHHAKTKRFLSNENAFQSHKIIA